MNYDATLTPSKKSHNVALIRPIADFVVALGSDGRIATQGSPDKTLQHDSKLLAELSSEEVQLEEAEQVLDKPELEAKDAQKNGKLVVAEEIKEGHVGWDTCEHSFGHPSAMLTLYPQYACSLSIRLAILSCTGPHT